MIPKNWMREAAREIEAKLDIYGDVTGSEQEIGDIIAKYSNMKPDIAYMPIPRCETCMYHSVLHDSKELQHCRYIRSYVPLHGLSGEPFGCVAWKEK